jgi:hypothetical protein
MADGRDIDGSMPDGRCVADDRKGSLADGRCVSVTAIDRCARWSMWSDD